MAWDRIMFPVRDPAGHTVAFLGRSSPGVGEGGPKYINSPETAIYNKGQLLFGVAEQQERLNARWIPVLVEGPADVLAVWLSYSRSAGPERSLSRHAAPRLPTTRPRSCESCPAPRRASWRRLMRTRRRGAVAAHVA
ncbi:hypothetical protein JNW88_31280, partial [Micromonospora sp. ATA32]|nr:hypothetical protein [Micromonospora sp. ATA32]